MIEPELRNEHVAAALADPKVGVILLDVVLGFGSHADPAGVLLKNDLSRKRPCRLGGRHRGRPAGLVAAGRRAARRGRDGGAVQRARRGARRIPRQLAPQHRRRAGERVPAGAVADCGRAAAPAARILQHFVHALVRLAGRRGREVRRADGAGAAASRGCSQRQSASRLRVRARGRAAPPACRRGSRRPTA